MGFLLCCNDACDIVMPQQPQFQMVAAFFIAFYRRMVNISSTRCQ